LKAYGERVPPERVKEFEVKVKPRLNKLRAIGDYISYIILNNNELLEDWEPTAIRLLEMAYKEVNLGPPAWIYMKYEPEENFYEDMKERIREFLLNAFIEKYTTRIAKLAVVDVDDEHSIQLDTIIRAVLTSYLIPWASLAIKDGYNEVRFTTGLVDELKPRVGEITLKSLAELLGWEYKVIKMNGRTTKAVVVKLDDLVRFLGETET